MPLTVPLSFPRQYARTRRFTLGVPRAFTISPDGRRVVFLRSRGGADPLTCLWCLDVDSGVERLIVDPRELPAAAPGEEELPPEERARRERVREQAGGVVAYACDRERRRVVFTVSGRLYVANLLDGGTRELAATTPVVDPRLDPGGKRIAYVSAGALRVVDDDADLALATPDGEDVTWGLAEFVAAEEMGRLRGHWWSPDGKRLLAARVDESPVMRWHVTDPADPARPPRRLAYPAAGTANADVSLAVITLDGRRTPVIWDRAAFPYLVTVRWESERPLIVVQSRDQRRMRVLSVDPDEGATTVCREDSDPAWVDIVPGVPALTASGALVWTADRDGARRLLLDDTPVTPTDLQVRAVLDVDGDTVLFTGSPEPTEVHLWTYGPDGLGQVSDGAGLHSGRRAGGTTVVVAQSLDDDGTRVEVRRGDRTVAVIGSLAERPVITPRVTLLRAGERALATAVLYPSWHEPGSGALPVLMDPYGGPHAQRVVRARGAYLASQWFAEQGFAVVVADGRGTPGRGPAFERAVHGDLATAALEDQVAALHAVAADHPDLDLSRVAIRGWSFGGYLAALAVLRRPDVFHAAVAGAPVTDWRLYDTHYTERYLGDPAAHAEAYDRCSLLGEAGALTRPLLLIHGLADDNVVAAHTLRLSSALLAAGRPHCVLPLSGVTHMTPQEVVAENLLLVQLEFLARALGLPARQATA